MRPIGIIVLAVGLLLLGIGTMFAERSPLFSALLPISIIPIVAGVILGRPER